MQEEGFKPFHECTRKDSIAYLNSNELFSKRYKVADWVLLTSGDHKVLVQLLPSDKIQTGYIQISKNDSDHLKRTGSLDNVNVCILNTPILTAAKIAFKTDDQIAKNDRDLWLLTVQQTLIELSHVIKGKVFNVAFKTRIIQCIITDINTPNGKVDSEYIYKVSTKVGVLDEGESEAVQLSQVFYDDIGGLSTQLKELTLIVNMGLYEASMFRDFGFKPIKGVLLYGPPGTGKTLLAKAVAYETKAHVIVLNGAEIISKYYGETEEKLRYLFEEARMKAPTIIFIDEIDALCPKREDTESELEKRVVATILSELDGPNSQDDRIVLIGATNRLNSLDSALRRPGRLDKEIEIGIPNALGRLDILSRLLKKVPHGLTQDEISRISFDTHGYVGADLASLCKEAGLKAMKRCIQDGTYADPESLELRMHDFESALTIVKPSAMKEIFLEIPKVKWSEVGGQEEIKQKLREAVEWPLNNPDVFKHFNIRPPKGILLYGPPGCSKTLLAKALATESGLNFIAVKGPELFSKWVGESEKAIQKVFKRARAASPSIIFFDEIDAVAVRRDSDDSSVGARVLSQLLNEMDGIEPLVNVTIIAATNRPDILDPALLRPGRIDRILYVGPPDADTRKQILNISTSRMKLGSVDFDFLVNATSGFSGAETAYLCQEAGFKALEEDINIECIEQRHFESALSVIEPRISLEMLNFYNDFKSNTNLKQL